MRVIRTEMYFDAAAIARLGADVDPGPNPGIAVAFFSNPTRIPVHFEDIAGEIIATSDSPHLGNVPYFLDLMLSVPTASSFVAPPFGRPRNDPIIQYIYEQPIVVEQSPPEWIPFEKLLKSASGAGIGTFIGVQAAGNNPLLLYVTVPIGIAVISSTLGVSKALENGLNIVISRLFKGK